MSTKQTARDKEPLSEAELDLIRANLNQQEQRIRDERSALQSQRTEFEREREAEIRRREKGDSASLSAARADLNRQEQRLKDAAAALNKQRAEFDLERESEEKRRGRSDLAEGLNVFRDEIMREIGRLKSEINADRGRDYEPVPDRDRGPYEPYDRDHDPYENAADISLNPKVSFREATESVPSFDGYNVPLAQFVRACRRAREIVPFSCERNLTKLIINKLRGRAYYAVEDEPCESITQLIDLLNGAFGSPKT